VFHSQIGPSSTRVIFPIASSVAERGVEPVGAQSIEQRGGLEVSAAALSSQRHGNHSSSQLSRGPTIGLGLPRESELFLRFRVGWWSLEGASLTSLCKTPLRPRTLNGAPSRSLGLSTAIRAEVWPAD
jgi:hypothetical protein